MPNKVRSDTGKLIAIDADGVLLDYNLAYAHAWKRAFGHLPDEKNPNAYWAYERWDVPRLMGRDLEHFRQVFDESFWSEIPLLPGAKEACDLLRMQGCGLVCVTALPERFLEARRRNLEHHALPIDQVVCVNHSVGDQSPKAAALKSLMPAAFVDDFLPYFRKVPSQIHRALIDRDVVGSPNGGNERESVTSVHLNFLEFALYWTEGSQAHPE